jgi:hypothetical protein
MLQTLPNFIQNIPIATPLMVTNKRTLTGNVYGTQNWKTLMYVLSFLITRKYTNGIIKKYSMILPFFIQRNVWIAEHIIEPPRNVLTSGQTIMNKKPLNNYL